MSDVHDLVAGFADAAAVYERGRPRYAPAVIDAVFEVVRGPRVLDLAAGTGLLSRALLERGLDVVAVELLDGMRAALASAIGPQRALAGRAEELPLPDASVDGAVCGDAWHWFDGPAAARELQRVVRPGGGVAVSSLLPEVDRESAWSREVGAILEPLRQAAQHPLVSGERRPSALEASGFLPLQRREIAFAHATDRDGLLAYFASISFVGAMEPAQRAEVLASLQAVLERHGVDEIEVPYRAELWVTRRLP